MTWDCKTENTRRIRDRLMQGPASTREIAALARFSRHRANSYLGYFLKHGFLTASWEELADGTVDRIWKITGKEPPPTAARAKSGKPPQPCKRAACQRNVERTDPDTGKLWTGTRYCSEACRHAVRGAAVKPVKRLIRHAESPAGIMNSQRLSLRAEELKWV